MDEFKNLNQSERRGRFLIQEIEEENNSIENIKKEKTTLNSIKYPNNKKLEKKRSKHSSFFLDSKILHLTHDDIKMTQPVFSTYIQFENNDWIDFEKVWSKFSCCHNDLSECDLERIFNYTFIQTEQSDFFDNFQKFLQASSAQCKTTDTITNIITSEQVLSPSIPKKSLTMDLKDTKNKLKRLEINFVANNFIVSPSFSPIINTNRTFSLDFTKLDKLNKQKEQKQCHSDKKNSKDINTSSFSNKKKFKVVKNIDFTLSSSNTVKIQNNRNKMYSIIKDNMSLISQQNNKNYCKCEKHNK